MEYSSYEYDRWDSDPRPHARYYRHSHRHSGHLTPEPQYSNLHRSHSQGHNVPHPTNIHIYNKIPQERERKAYDDFLRKQREKEEAEEKAYRDALRKQKEKEEAKEREYQAFLREQKEKQEAEEKAKKEEQARIDSAMRARLEKLGFSQHDIEIALDPEKAEKEKKKKKKHRHSEDVFFDDDVIMVGGPPTLSEASPAIAVGFPQHHVPVYPRINRKYLDIETLEHYRVPWEWDRANSDFIILLRELDKYETDVLFEHTRRRRQGSSAHLTIDKVKDSAPKLAFVRRKSKERSKSRGRDIRVTEIVRR
ncbi:uncharacterized protein M437DRAFT_74580 [Aureobasidium melanogenum CBS 110374]|uniref:Uncharacterized protein n=1 Tax=Aureobasidium melanogenum (strain CBS 110374) TaxID=1043003 RepID=A0A074W275_AURM1|nr:uncharacterized protein M437DRAFT_74580 [Aureobasidium melanogenum CBS 110374]KEQ64022.1 hypothetical protein M437DRAFT_74580 [Aureobasidium melanogenum CBS 110374]